MSSVGDRRLKVFISYSRKDEDFAQDLLAGLQIAGFEPYLDKHDIAAGEDWEARLGRLIEAADTVVFLISPDAVAKQLNYIFFDRPFSFGASLQALSTALRTDIEWIREHTRIAPRHGSRLRPIRARADAPASRVHQGGGGC